MKKVIRRIIGYVCDVCDTHYPSAALAKACEAGSTEPLVFKKGDRVRIKVTRTCDTTNKRYHAEAVIIGVQGPQCVTTEYRHQWPQRARLHGHVYQYIAEHICPYCNTSFAHSYYEPELSPVPPPTRRTVSGTR